MTAWDTAFNDALHILKWHRRTGHIMVHDVNARAAWKRLVANPDSPEAGDLLAMTCGMAQHYEKRRPDAPLDTEEKLREMVNTALEVLAARLRERVGVAR